MRKELRSKIKALAEEKLTPLALIGIGVALVSTGISYGTTTMGLLYTVAGSVAIIAGCLWFYVENSKD